MSQVHPSGLYILGAKFDKALELASATIPFPIRFKNCIFDEPISLGYAKIQSAEFDGCKINGGFSGNGLSCEGHLDIRSSKYGQRSICNGTIDLIGASVGTQLDLSGTVINAKPGSHEAVNVQQTRISGSVLFTSVGDYRFEAEGRVAMNGAIISRQLDFGGASLRNPNSIALLANGLVVGDRAYFTRAGVRYHGNDMPFEAEGLVSLAHASIEGGLFFNGSILSEPPSSQLDIDCIADVVLDLSAARIQGALCFVTRADTTGETAARLRGNVLLRHARSEQLYDSPQVWALGRHQDGLRDHDAPSVGLDGFEYRSVGRCVGSLEIHFRRRWLLSGANFGGDFAPQPYTQLATVLRAAGHEDDAKKVLIAGRQQRRLRVLTGWRGLPARLLDRGNHWALGYGYRTWRVLIPVLLLYVIGVMWFDLAWQSGRFNPAVPFVYNSYYTDSEGVQIQRHTAPYSGDIASDGQQATGDLTQRPGGLDAYPRFNPLVYSADALVPLVDLHQESFWLPTGSAKVFLWFQIAGGWGLTTIAVAGITGLVRRD